MRKSAIDKAWFTSAITEKFGSLSAFGEATGLRQPKVTNILKGTRRVQIYEAQTIARLLGKRVQDVLTALGDSLDGTATQKLDGYVGASEEVIIFEHGSDDYGLDEVEMVMGHFAGVLLQIRGDSMSPRYMDGEIIGIHADPTLDVPPIKLLGEEVVAKGTDGRVLLKILQAGRQPDRFSLVSMNPRVPPIVEVELEWVRPVEFKLPARARKPRFR